MLRVGSARRPKKVNILGMEFAGAVDSIGKNVTRFKVGDRVFGASWRFGAHAEYACFPERSIVKMPNNASFEEAAAITYGGVSALYFLKRAGIKAGHKKGNVVINIASDDAAGLGVPR